MSMPPFVSGPRRWVYLAIGWGSFGLGVIGVFLPVLPTTPFMIIALWAFSNSSLKLRNWLYTHRIFGRPLQRWNEHRVIPPFAKISSLGAMTVSLSYLAFFTDTKWPILMVTGLIMAVGAGYVLTKPSYVKNSE